MSERLWNFSPGPATLPLSVLERVRDDLVALPGAGASVLEISHRSAAFEAIVEEAEQNLRELLSVPRRASRPLPAGRGLAPVLHGADEPARRGDRGVRGDRLVGEEGARRGQEGRHDTRGLGRHRDLVHQRAGPRGARARSLGCVPARHLERDDPGHRVPARVRTRGRSAARVRRVLRLPLTPDHDRPLRPAVRGRAEERRTRRAHDRVAPRGPARADPRRPPDDARLPNPRREPVPLQHAVLVRDLRVHARDAVAAGRDRRSRGDARAQSDEGRRPLRGRRHQRGLLPRPRRRRRLAR